MTGYREISAQLEKEYLQPVIFESRTKDSESWMPLGTDYNWPYRVYVDPNLYISGTTVQVRARLMDDKGAARAKDTAFTIS